MAPAPAAQAGVQPQLDEALSVLLLSPRSLVVTTSTDKRLQKGVGKAGSRPAAGLGCQF